MISVEAALAALFAASPRMPDEGVPLREAAGRVLAAPAAAARAQPPFDAASMDGYAVAGDPRPGDRLEVIGEAIAGRRFQGIARPGQAVRILTGAPVPDGAIRVVIQEDVRREGDAIALGGRVDPGPHIRPAGSDFPAGFALRPPRRLRPADLALLAAMDVPEVAVARRPDVAIVPTGDELVMPGDAPGPDQIVASNVFGLAALVAEEGGLPRLLPIARDTAAALDQAFDLANGADLVLTVGGASVGDRDLVAEAAAARGLTPAFHKVAMRPGKPLLAGRMGDALLIGLPGNPVSAMACGEVFVRPVLRAMQGLPARPMPRRTAPLAADVDANGPREHYMRARIEDGRLRPFARQDSALLHLLADADALVVRPAHDGARRAGTPLPYLPLRALES